MALLVWPWPQLWGLITEPLPSAAGPQGRGARTKGLKLYKILSKIDLLCPFPIIAMKQPLIMLSDAQKL